MKDNKCNSAYLTLQICSDICCWILSVPRRSQFTMNFTLGKPFVSQSRSGPQSIFSWLIHSWLLDSYILLSHFHDFSKWSKLNKGSIIKYFLTELSGTRWRNIWLWVISHRPQSPAHPDEPYHGLHTSAPLVLDYLINLEGRSGSRQYLLKPE